MERAVEFYGADPQGDQAGVFNLAGFSKALREQTGLFEGVDGKLCRVILADRDDVEQFGTGDCYYRIIGTTGGMGRGVIVHGNVGTVNM
jgi:hypothetical protein